MGLNSKEADIIRILIQRNNELQIRVERLEKFVYSLWILAPKWLRNYLLKREMLPPAESMRSQLMKWSHIDSIPDTTITVAWSVDAHGERPKEITPFDDAEGY